MYLKLFESITTDGRGLSVNVPGSLGHSHKKAVPPHEAPDYLRLRKAVCVAVSSQGSSVLAGRSCRVCTPALSHPSLQPSPPLKSRPSSQQPTVGSQSRQGQGAHPFLFCTGCVGTTKRPHTAAACVLDLGQLLQSFPCRKQCEPEPALPTPSSTGGR